MRTYEYICYQIYLNGECLSTSVSVPETIYERWTYALILQVINNSFILNYFLIHLLTLYGPNLFDGFFDCVWAPFKIGSFRIQTHSGNAHLKLFDYPFLKYN